MDKNQEYLEKAWNNHVALYGQECRYAFESGWKSAVRDLTASITTQMQSPEPIAVLRYETGQPGQENEMPRVVFCNWMPDGEYRVYLQPSSISNTANPVGGVLTVEEILQVFADVVSNQEPDAGFINVTTDQAVRIADYLISRTISHEQSVNKSDKLPPEIKETIRQALIAQHASGKDQKACDDALNWLADHPCPSRELEELPSINAIEGLVKDLGWWDYELDDVVELVHHALLKFTQPSTNTESEDPPFRQITEEGLQHAEKKWLAGDMCAQPSVSQEAHVEQAEFEEWVKNTNQGYDLTRNFSEKMATYENDLTEHAYRGFFHALSQKAEEQDKLQEENKRLREALESIWEYWNRDQSVEAMQDACCHAVDTAFDALQESSRWQCS